MRILQFNNIKRYEFFYEGLLATPSKGAEARAISRILTKLEEIGVPKSEKSLLYTLAQDGIVKLEESQFELAKRKLNEVEWNGPAVREAGKLLEWLEEKHTEEEYKASVATSN